MTRQPMRKFWDHLFREQSTNPGSFCTKEACNQSTFELAKGAISRSHDEESGQSPDPPPYES